MEPRNLVRWDFMKHDPDIQQHDGEGTNSDRSCRSARLCFSFCTVTVERSSIFDQFLPGAFQWSLCWRRCGRWVSLVSSFSVVSVLDLAQTVPFVLVDLTCTFCCMAHGRGSKSSRTDFSVHLMEHWASSSMHRDTRTHSAQPHELVSSVAQDDCYSQYVFLWKCV